MGNRFVIEEEILKENPGCTVEHKVGRIFSYATPGKGINGCRTGTRCPILNSRSELIVQKWLLTKRTATSALPFD